jgi:hypothetical protein
MAKLDDEILKIQSRDVSRHNSNVHTPSRGSSFPKTRTGALVSPNKSQLSRSVSIENVNE